MRGSLLTHEFLFTGITETAAWRGLEAGTVEAFGTALRQVFARFPHATSPNEAVTEQALICPILEALGWDRYLLQQTTSARGRLDVPDTLLFPDEEAKHKADQRQQEADRFRFGVAILESKRWHRNLDRAETEESLDSGTPAAQILRYLSRADVVSNGRIRWGILTNGRFWRLYWQGARSRSEEFLELDLAVLADAPGIQPDIGLPEVERREHFLQVFFLLFRRQAFLPEPTDPATRSFLEIARAESRLWEEKVSSDLGRVVFEEVYPGLLSAIIANDPEAPTTPPPAYLEEVRRAALTLLYRLLFVLYAEDRGLLPSGDPRYDDYSLRRARRDVAERLDRLDALSSSAARYYGHLEDLFRAVAEGDPSIGLPPYDGGLFERGYEALVRRIRLPDRQLAPLIDALSRRQEGSQRRWINYRDLSVQHLGAIYERLLEFEPVIEADNTVRLRPNVFARKASGSYYTHEDLVHLILESAIGPLIQEIGERFESEAARLARQRRPKADRLRELAGFDPATRILDLKVCDPAMGSGHFLVSLVDYLADATLERMAAAETEVGWASGNDLYRSPLRDRIASIRREILASAEAEGWSLDPRQLDDRHIVRRIILKRVTYGVDKNPMAVELAKVALWLHTFTAGAPLSFLDHHLRCGDSLFGEWLDGVSAELQQAGALFLGSERAKLTLASKTMSEVAEISDTDIAEVHRSQELFEQAEATLRPLRLLLDFWHALRWLSPPNGEGNSPAHPGLRPLLHGVFGDLLQILAKGAVNAGDPKQAAEATDANELLAAARRLVEQERFLHWQLAFPTVWRSLDREGLYGGFDAVIGNPPWDRMKLQEVEWFAAREPAIARAQRAADRKRLIQRLETADAPLWRDYLAARDAAESAARVARESGDYPLLAKGDMNLYSLFVERAQGLLQPRGIVGLLTPSGIASDLGASEFFRSIATSGRLGALLDFENKKVFFPDIDSRQKFCALVFGAGERFFASTRCAFFLHAVAELQEGDRVFELRAADFAAVNPNTGTAPLFRTRRDAALTAAVYERLPVLVDRRGSEPKYAWPVKYLRMFDMTNSSGLFRTKAELEEQGLYPTGQNLWKKGETEYVPLYEGKMVQAYDHRAASVVVHSDNLHRPAQPAPASPEQHRDPSWLPAPQFWVDRARVRPFHRLGWALAFKEITAPTNARTMIACLAPAVAFGNKLPLLLPAPDLASDSYVAFAPLLLATLNSFAFDFIARQKVHGQTINLFILEQLPVLPAASFEGFLGGRAISEFIRSQVLRLSYTAEDLEPLARDLGFKGAPFPWDEEDRRHRLARLDALCFHLYGFTREDADYILSQFSSVRDDDEKEHGRYLTRDLILAYMNAVAAGDLDTVVSPR